MVNNIYIPREVNNIYLPASRVVNNIYLPREVNNIYLPLHRDIMKISRTDKVSKFPENGVKYFTQHVLDSLFG